MRLFRCDNCNNIVHFENRACLACGFALGFVSEDICLHALAVDSVRTDRWRRIDQPQSVYRFCANAGHNICNWLVQDDRPEAYCVACRHNGLVPDPNTPQGLRRWRAIADAQRHLFYSFLRWDLPRPTRAEDRHGGLLFDLKDDEVLPDGSTRPAIIGHKEGHIVIRTAEADPLTREHQREMMNEPYRTLLGHFRHETGHFLWNRLVRDQGKRESCRAVFGDERRHYDRALAQHYQRGAPPNWAQHYISDYAASHPWEDFAECCAHVLHIVDSLETAHVHGMVSPGQAGFDPYAMTDFRRIAQMWIPLSVALNAVHHSLGERDLYPFLLTPTVTTKLAYVHGLMTRQI